MMGKRITKITAQKRNPNRVNIFLDGEFAFSLDRLNAAWLTKGRQLSESEIEQLLTKEEFTSALGKALRFLGYRARSHQEMECHLQGKGYQEGLIRTVLQRLEADQLLDDSEFAVQWIDNRQCFRPRSQRLMKLELRQKGLDERVIDAAFEKADLEELDLALSAGRKLLGRYQNLEKQEFRRKLAGALQRRGFSYDTVKECLAQLEQELSKPEGVEN
jgi:regulatory protein